MKSYDIFTFNLEDRKDDSIVASITTENTTKYVKLTEDNIYDLVENPSIRRNLWVFAVNDRYPALKLYYSNRILCAEYIDEKGMIIDIQDKSPKGLMKWLYRILYNTPSDKLFAINREMIYNE